MNVCLFVFAAFSCGFITVFGTTITVKGKLYCCYGGETNFTKTTTTTTTTLTPTNWISSTKQPYTTTRKYYGPNYIPKKNKKRDAANSDNRYCEPIVNAEVSLWEEDGYWGLDGDDLLNHVKTDQNRGFSLEGSEYEFGFPTFFVLAKTTCGIPNPQVTQNLKCKRFSKIYLGSHVNNDVYDFSAHPPHHAWIIAAEKLGGNDYLQDDFYGKYEKC